MFKKRDQCGLMLTHLYPCGNSARSAISCCRTRKQTRYDRFIRVLLADHIKNHTTIPQNEKKRCFTTWYSDEKNTDGFFHILIIIFLNL